MKYKILLAVCFSFVFAGCSTIPTAQIEAFGEKSNSLSKDVSVVIDEFYEAQRKKEVEVAISAGGQIQTLNSLKVFDNKLFKTAKDAKKSSLVKASQALNNYFNMIHQLTLIGDKEKYALTGAELSTAVFSLNDAHKALGGNGELISKEDAAKIGKITGSVSYLYAKNRAAKAIRKIVVSADPAIQKLVSAMDDTLSRGFIKKELYGYRSEHVLAMVVDYSTHEAEMRMPERREELNKILDEYKKLQGTSEAIENTRKTLKAIGAAHAKLAGSLRKKEYTGKDIIDAVKSLENEGKYFDKVEETFIGCASNQLEAKANEGLVCK